MRLVNMGNGMWLLTEDGYQLEGSWTVVKAHMLNDLEFDLEQIDIAIEEMDLLDHDTASFGVNNVFVVTFNSQKVNKVIAELKAIRAVKQEMFEAFQADKDGAEFKAAQQRLLTLALTLDETTALSVIDPDNQYMAA
jgi:hypothetical protein